LLLSLCSVWGGEVGLGERCGPSATRTAYSQAAAEVYAKPAHQVLAQPLDRGAHLCIAAVYRSDAKMDTLKHSGGKTDDISPTFPIPPVELVQHAADILPSYGNPTFVEKWRAATAVFKGLYRDLFADDELREARKIAFAAIGATRGLDPDAEITLPGAIGTAPQAVDISRLLLLRWNGGAPPFQIELAEASMRQRVVETSERNARLDLGAYPRGAYTLTFAAKNDVRLSLPLNLVAPVDVPLAPGIEAAQDPEARELVEAVWLLARAPITWRLEALSRLELLAKDKDNIVAQAIVEPAPSPEGDKGQ
jgi:hypothetical protein